MSPRLTRDKPDFRPLDGADARTLQFATVVLDDALLDRWVRHQEVYLGIAEGVLASGRPLPEALEEAHRQAFRASGLTGREEGAVASAVRTFCTFRHAMALLDRKLARVRAQGAGPEVEEQLQALRAERSRLGALKPLEQRYGPEVVARLQAREQILCPIHERLTRLLSRGG